MVEGGDWFDAEGTYPSSVPAGSCCRGFRQNIYTAWAIVSRNLLGGEMMIMYHTKTWLKGY